MKVLEKHNILGHSSFFVVFVVVHLNFRLVHVLLHLLIVLSVKWDYLSGGAGSFSFPLGLRQSVDLNNDVDGHGPSNDVQGSKRDTEESRFFPVFGCQAN